MLTEKNILLYITTTRHLFMNKLVEYDVLDETADEIKIHIKYLDKDNGLCFYNYSYLKNDIFKFIRSQKLIKLQNEK